MEYPTSPLGPGRRRILVHRLAHLQVGEGLASVAGEEGAVHGPHPTHLGAGEGDAELLLRVVIDQRQLLPRLPGVEGLGDHAVHGLGIFVVVLHRGVADLGGGERALPGGLEEALRLVDLLPGGPAVPGLEDQRCDFSMSGELAAQRKPVSGVGELHIQDHRRRVFMSCTCQSSRRDPST